MTCLHKWNCLVCNIEKERKKRYYLPKVAFKKSRAFLASNRLVNPFLISLSKVAYLRKVAKIDYKGEWNSIKKVMHDENWVGSVVRTNFVKSKSFNLNSPDLKILLFRLKCWTWVLVAHTRLRLESSSKIWVIWMSPIKDPLLIFIWENKTKKWTKKSTWMRMT